jgi:hypothetical protein
MAVSMTVVHVPQSPPPLTDDGMTQARADQAPAATTANAGAHRADGHITHDELRRHLTVVWARNHVLRRHEDGHLPRSNTDYQPPSRIGFREPLRWFGFDLTQARPEYFLEAKRDRTIVYHVAEGQPFGLMRLMTPVAALVEADL